MLTRILGILGILSMGVGVGCRDGKVAAVDEPARPERLMARAQLQPAAGEDVEGEVRMRETDQGIRMEVMVRGLTPGEHGFHIHEFGDCSAPDFESAGGHFNPGGDPHGPPGPKTHAGDLGNVEADDDGVVETVMIARYVELEPGERTIVGKAIVIHADPDDLTSQPSGNAGARVACGVIELEPPR